MDTSSPEPKAIPAFQKEVRCFKSSDLIKDALFYMRDHEFSQLVVRQRSSVALLSTEGIVKWMTALLTDGKDRIALCTVGEAIPFQKSGTFAVMGPDTSVSAVREGFRADDNRPRLAAVIITDDGTARGKPIGFADPWDLLLTYSDDFRNIQWRGRSFKLSHRQAKVVRLLYRAYESGITELSDKFICSELGTPNSRLRDTFRKSPAWDKLIVEGSKPGMSTLNI